MRMRRVGGGEHVCGVQIEKRKAEGRGRKGCRRERLGHLSAAHHLTNANHLAFVRFGIFPFQEMQIMLLQFPSSAQRFLIQHANQTGGRTEPHESVSGSPLTGANQQANHPFKVRVSED